MDERLESALIECLDALEQAQPIDQILARYPELVSELRPMLETAVALPQINVQPSLAAHRRSRDAFLAQAAAQKASKVVRPSPWLNLRRRLIPFTALALIVIIFAAGLSPLSAEALPGDVLYGSKILVENVRSALTTNSAADAALTEQFNQRRIQEINALLAQNRTADVAFTGEIEAVQPASWTISGLATEINHETQISSGVPQVGQMAMVNGRTQDGHLVATTITLLPTDEPPPTATPTASPTPTRDEVTKEPTETATPSPTYTPTQTATAVPTATATITETPEPSPTFTALPTETLVPPTATPEPDDGGDDNDDGGSNNNSNDNDDDDDNDDDHHDDNGNDNSNDNDDDD